jgi:hypothetical protein
MNLRSARRVVVLGWVLLALLPLRAWAGVAMHLPGASGAQGLAEAAPPCHGHAAARDDARGDASASHGDASASHAAHGDASASHTTDDTACTLCDLCHGSAAVIAVPAFDPGPCRAQAPALAVPSSVLQVDPAPLYRPPRG